jgi:NADH-quinone oxidoreductase subunit G
VDWTFGTEELSSYSRSIQQVEREPLFYMNSKDASRMGFQEKERIAIQLDRGAVSAELLLFENMAPGIIVMPRHRKLAWQKMERWPVKIAVHQIKK